MLRELHIESLGVIDSLTVPFGPGLTALTGETGAGKTMLVEALALLLGGRADAGVVRHGCAEARVEGRFEVDGVESVVGRVIPADGRSRAYRDGRLITAATLAELVGGWVELHGQNTHQRLATAADQRDRSRTGRNCGTPGTVVMTCSNASAVRPWTRCLVSPGKRAKSPGPSSKTSPSGPRRTRPSTT